MLDAPRAEERPTTLVFAPEFLALLVHESCGHPTEADRLLEHEVAFAGTTFMWPEDRGKLRYGSPHVSMTADATVPGGMGTFGWDDDGVPAMRTKLVEKGTFVGYLTSRETAARRGLPRSGGCLRAEARNRFPIIRMINVSLEPDPRGPSLEQLIADTDDGVLMGNNKSWSIDDKRLNFQFGCELAWEIKGGKKTRLLKNAIYTGITPNFWRSCDAICNENYWTVWGTPNCGKGQPQQVMGTGHGAAPSRFRAIKVGIAYKGS